MEEKISNLLILLARGIANSRLYDCNHPKIRGHADDFVTALQEFLREVEANSFFVGIVDGNIVYQGCNLVGPNIMGRQLIAFADKLNCGGITFKYEVTREEVLEFLSLASDLNTPLTALQEGREMLLSRGVVNIQIAYHFSSPSDLIPRDKRNVWQGKDSNQLLQSPALIYQALFDVVSSAHGAAAEDKKLDLDTTQSVSEYLLEYSRTNFSDMMQQIHYPDFDTYTVGHSVRVAALAVFAGTQLKMPKKSLLEFGTAALLHDVGKSKIPEEILFKPSRLTAEEFEVIQTHSRLGAEILLAQENTNELDISAAWGHHIRHDGKGYPEHPNWGTQQPLTSLMQICDVFEALTATRPYKPPMPPQAAFSIMLADEGAFHPVLLAAFISAIGLYPPGNNVVLSDGRRGTVVSVGEHIDRPKIEITHVVDNTSLAKKDAFLIDLEQREHSHLSIAELFLR